MPVIQRFIEENIVKYGQLSKQMADDRTPQWEPLDKTFLAVLGK